jgi:NADH:ubiquinone oxidoreductase subunit K
MEFFHNISTVAHYEAKTLRRSWFFRLFSIAAVVILTFMNIGIFSPIGDETWSAISIPSALPLISLYLLNIGQAIVVIFLAADFLKRDKKLDTNEVLYTRPMSNFEYVTGKTLGILRLFISLDLLILAIGLTINIISKRMSLDLASYIQYLLIIPIPTIIFSLGLAFILMSVVRNQAITFLLLLGYAAMNMFYLWFRAGSVFDYMAFGIPVFKSGMIGFENISIIIYQRLIYFCLGMSMVFGTILLFKRLPQSNLQKNLAIALMTVFLTGSGYSLYRTLMVWQSGKEIKESVISINRQFELKDFPNTIRASIEVLHKGTTIEATADLEILNDNDLKLDRYIFSLNPSLTVSKVISGGTELQFKREGHILVVDPGRFLAPGDKDSLKIFYSGTISEAFCYPNYADNIKENPYRIIMVNVKKRQAFLTDDYVLLTPETHWYPVSGLNYYPTNPARVKVDFTRFSLNAKSNRNLVAVSQGIPSENNGTWSYRSEVPYTGLTLAMGKYITDTIKIDSVDYIMWHYKGNDYYKNDLTELKDTLKYLVSGVMRELETNFTVKYPFKTLSFVEAPVQYFSFPRKNTQTRAEVQPSMVLIPERLATIDQAGFGKRFTRQKKQMARNNQVITDKELQVRLFNTFIRNTFISGENYQFRNGTIINEPTRFRLGPSFYFFRNNFFSPDYPVINAVFESHLQRVNAPARPQWVEMMSGNVSDNDRANIILKGKSFRELMAQNPGDDTIRTVLSVKGDYLFNLIRSKAGISEFSVWFRKYLDDNSFSRINLHTFSNDINARFGFEFYPYLKSWFDGKDQPGFLITGLQAKEIVVGDRSRYHVSFIAANHENTGGLFNISFQTGGISGGNSGRTGFDVQSDGGRMTYVRGSGMEASGISKIIYLPPREAKKISLVTDNQPRVMIVNTLSSKNLPGEIKYPIDDIVKSKDKSGNIKNEEVNVPLPAFSEGNEMIVDNEDSGFVNLRKSDPSPLKRILGVKNQQDEVYGTIRQWNSPDFWQPIILSSYYGLYVRSAVYTRSGKGDKTVTWRGIIKKPGYYDIYVFIGKVSDRVSVKGAGKVQEIASPGAPMASDNNDPYKDLHYKVYHDDGVEDVTVDWKMAEPEWNKIGTFYLSPDTVKVTLSNQSQGPLVIGDAVKWVLQK